MLTHIVIFWLKADSPAGAREKLLGDLESLLRKIPTVRHLTTGRPAMTPRDVVDNSYDAALCTIFDDAAGLEAYQVHESHQQFLSRNKANFARVLVYDFKS